MVATVGGHYLRQRILTALQKVLLAQPLLIFKAKLLAVAETAHRDPLVLSALLVDWLDETVDVWLVD